MQISETDKDTDPDVIEFWKGERVVFLVFGLVFHCLCGKALGGKGPIKAADDLDDAWEAVRENANRKEFNNSDVVIEGSCSRAVSSVRRKRIAADHCGRKGHHSEIETRHQRRVFAGCGKRSSGVGGTKGLCKRKEKRHGICSKGLCFF